jgi:hypothetical protein
MLILFKTIIKSGSQGLDRTAFGLSGVTLTPPVKNLVEVRNSKVLQIFVSLFFVIFSAVHVIFEWKRRLWPSKWYIICAY